MEIILNRQATLEGKTLSPGSILDLPESQAEKVIAAGYAAQVGPLTDPEEMKKAFQSCSTTWDLFRTTFRFAGESWPTEVFREVWDVYEQCEARLIEKGEPPVSIYFKKYRRESS